MIRPQERMEVRSSKMSMDMQRMAMDTAQRALEEDAEPRAVASSIKRKFDQLYDPHWQCIVGNHFARWVSTG
ncbi:unnamed protein product [Mesocestoides corti]|uniref:Dynein light chain n=1 Tax=Mesocestoides corti TaxID=53468 RepID=A0A0R3UPP6_MESCO|nr:unnamed protein product [Mesocestoides corti]